MWYGVVFVTSQSKAKMFDTLTKMVLNLNQKKDLYQTLTIDHSS